jgi:hypothetical protein
MSVVDLPPPSSLSVVCGPSLQEAAWGSAEGEAVAVMGTVNVAIARLVAAVRGLLDSDGWDGVGIRSPEQWLCWKANVSRSRAEGLVTIARRAGDLPACWALFEQGRLGEDAMGRIARRVPAERDIEVAAIAPQLLISQLDRLLRSLPEQPDGSDRPATPAPDRMLAMRERRDGWLRGEFCLPPDEAAVVRLGLTSARDAEFRDRNDLPEADRDDTDPAEVAGARLVSWADGLVRMASEAADALDPTYRRTGQRGERNTVVLHVELDPDGTSGPAQLEMGPVIPDLLARFLACDAQVQVMTYRLGHLIGIHPTQRTPNRAMRRYLARRDQGCTHPLCTQRLWLHAHHIVHWEDGGPTAPHNLVLLCPLHHRALHLGEFSIVGDPEAGSIRFLDRWGNTIRPPDLDPPGGDPPRHDRRPPGTSPYRPPLAERLTADTFAWN